MYKNVIRSLFLLALSGASMYVHAFGIGLYTTAINSGTADWDEDYCIFSSCPGFETDIDQKEFGFMLDTAIAKDRLFNYRLQLAIVDSSYNDGDLDGIALTNTFGFGVVRTSSMRVWLGPQLAVKILEGKGSSDADLVGIELGLGSGVNVHLGSTVSIVAELGYRLGASYLESSSTDYTVDETRFFANIGVLFRFGSDYY